jgi:flagellar hook-associated protein 3 FlgL
MRITNRMIVQNAIQQMQNSLEGLSGLQEKAASGKMIQKPSDDPAAAAAALSLRSSLRAQQSYLDAAGLASDWISASETALKQMESLASQALKYTLDGVSDSKGAEARKALAGQIDHLFGDALTTANSTHLGSYIFAGFKVKDKPYIPSLVDPSQIVYAGDNGVMRRSIGPNQTITANTDSETAFLALFGALKIASQALNGTDSAAISAAAGGLQSALDQVSQLRAGNGIRQAQVRATERQLEEMQLSLKHILSQTEDANMIEVVALLRQQESVYQTVLEVSNRTLATANLFEYLS